MPSRLSASSSAFHKLFLAAAISASPLAAQASLVDFSAFSNIERESINGQQDSLSKDSITATAARYQGNSSYTYAALWIRNDAGDHGLGVCSEGLSKCGGDSLNPLIEGRGDWNELGNNYRDETIRLERAENTKWSDFWVSSLDTKTLPGRESGRFYWSNEAKANLNAMNWITFNQNQLGWEAAQEEGSIFDYLVSNGFDTSAKFVYFRADVGNGFDNDYLVYKAGTTAVPLPPGLLLMGSALAAMGFIPRRRA